MVQHLFQPAADISPALVPAATDDLVMAQSQRLVHFEFAALDYAEPERNRFVYRLSGFDPDWIGVMVRG